MCKPLYCDDLSDIVRQFPDVMVRITDELPEEVEIALGEHIRSFLPEAKYCTPEEFNGRQDFTSELYHRTLSLIESVVLPYVLSRSEPVQTISTPQGNYAIYRSVLYGVTGSDYFLVIDTTYGTVAGIAISAYVIYSRFFAILIADKLIPSSEINQEQQNQQEQKEEL